MADKNSPPKEASIACDRGPSTPVFVVYVLDAKPWWNDYLQKWNTIYKKVFTSYHLKEAEDYCKNRNIEYEEVE